MIRIRIVPPELKHLSRIMEISEQCCSQPWTRQDFMNVFSCPDMTGAVLDTQHDIVGFLFYCVQKKVFDVWNMAIAEEYQRQGFGTVLIEHLKERLQRGVRKKIRVLLSERDLSRQLFFRSCGFRWEETKRLPALEEDVYLMEYRRVVIPNNRLLRFGGFVDASNL